MIDFQIFWLLCIIFAKDVLSAFPDFEESISKEQNIGDSKARFLKITDNNEQVSSMKLLKTAALLHGFDINLPVEIAGQEEQNHQDVPQNNTVLVEDSTIAELKESLQIVFMRFLSFKLFAEMFHCAVHFFLVPTNLMRNEECLGAMASILKFHLYWRANEKIEKFPKLHEMAMELDASKLRSATKSIFDFLETKTVVIPDVDESSDTGIEETNVDSYLITRFLDDMHILHEPLASLNKTSSSAAKYFNLVLRAPVTDSDENSPFISKAGLPSLWSQIVELATFLEPTEADDIVSFEKMRNFVFEDLILRTKLSDTKYEQAKFEVIPKSKRYADFTVVF